MVTTEFDYLPWLYSRQAGEDDRLHQRSRQAELGVHADFAAGADVFVSSLAAVFVDRLVMGTCSYVAAHVYLTGDVEMGEHCTLNPYAVARGRIRMAGHVRVGAHTSLLGFNHGFAPDRRVHEQPTTSVGIEIGEDVWIGSHVVVLDGVRIGAHAVVGAGAVVTKDVPAWAVVAGNPARWIRDRRDAGDSASTVSEDGSNAEGDGNAEDGSNAEAGHAHGDRSTAPAATAPRATAPGATAPAATSALVARPALATRLAAFAQRARTQALEVLTRAWQPDHRLPGPAEIEGSFLDRPGATPTVRAWCDAIEVADLLTGEPPPQTDRARLTKLLSGWQDPRTGLVAEIGAAAPPCLDDGPALYHVLSVGYALELLDAAFEEPIHAVAGCDAGEVVTRLTNLPWHERAWSAGAWVDAIGTALYRNRCDFHAEEAARDRGVCEALLGWLVAHADPFHGLWGRPDRHQGWLQVVNGFYRASRGTFAQFGVPIPYPERVVDSVLAHAEDPRYFGPGRGNACNVLDVIHPLWLCARQSDHRLADGQAWARGWLEQALAGWQDGAGFAFDLFSGRSDAGGTPGLQGTEMWLAIIWLLADYLGESPALGYRPRGVHRPEPALAWSLR